MNPSLSGPRIAPCPAPRTPAAVLIALATAALAGCAAFHPDAVARHQDGWKAGYVRRVGTADQLGEAVKHDCRRDATAASGQTYAEVGYRHGHAWRTAIAVVRPGTAPAAGQEVWMPTRDCSPIELQ